MGCDIHMYVERKINGKWCNADYFVPNPDWEPDQWGGMLSPEQQEALDNGILPDHWCQSRTPAAGYEFREWEEDNEVLVPLINKLKERCDDLYMIYKFEWNSSNESTRRSAYRNASDIRIVFWFDN